MSGAAGSPPAVVLMDGRCLAPAEQRVSVFDRGFLYGDSVFETLRTYGGVPFRLREHLERLATSAARVFMPLPVSLSQLSEEVTRAVEAVDAPEATLRLMITRGEGAPGLTPDPGLVSRRVVIAQPLRALPLRVYEQGVKAVLCKAVRPTDLAGVGGAKIGNYLVSIIAMRQAQEAGAHEALIVDTEGRVLEGATSNVFWVEDGAVWTPPASVGILEGITRGEAIACSHELNRLVQFDCPSVARLRAADEVFITSSIRELVPVVAVGDHRVGSGSVGPIFEAIRERFRARVRQA